MRRLIGPLLLGAVVFACSSGSENAGGNGGAAAGGGATGSGTAGVSSGGSAGSPAGGGQGGSKAGSTSGGSPTTAGSAGAHSGAGGMIMCPPCAAPPAPNCVGSGPCGCGPYICPSGGAGGEGGAGGAGEACGPVTCEPPLECCNPLMGKCVMPGMVCAQ